MLPKIKEGTISIYNGQTVEIPAGTYEVEIGCGYGGGIDAELVPIEIREGFTKDQLIDIVSIYTHAGGTITPEIIKMTDSIIETAQNLLASEVVG